LTRKRCVNDRVFLLLIAVCAQSQVELIVKSLEPIVKHVKLVSHGAGSKSMHPPFSLFLAQMPKYP